MSAHTPGPWFIADDDRNGQSVVRNEHIEIATCWHHCVGAIEKEMRFNARLIAAAPDLLSALAALMALGDAREPKNSPLYEDARRAARAAIAKATS